MSSQNEGTPEIYGIASNDEMSRYLKVKKIKLINEGVTTGVSGVLLAKCSAQNFPAFSLLAESKMGYPDPRASAALLKRLEEVIGLKIDVKALLEEASIIEARIKKMMEQIRRDGGAYQRASEEYPSMYE
jgi:predicted ATP-grasp superfamily ATP-dependent carboligase